MTSLPFYLLPFAAILLSAGCARYEYDVVEPPDLAGHVGTRSWVSLQRENQVEYRLRTADNRLVMLICNRGGRPLKLLSEESALVDPRGESRPVAGATLLPGSYVKRVLPPPRPRVEPYGPSMGFGAGGGFGSARYGRGFRRHHDPLYYGGFDDVQPRHYTVYDLNDRTFFHWPGGTTVRFLLAFEREDGETFRHEFLIRRSKM